MDLRKSEDTREVAAYIVDKDADIASTKSLQELLVVMLIVQLSEVHAAHLHFDLRVGLQDKATSSLQLLKTATGENQVEAMTSQLLSDGESNTFGSPCDESPTTSVALVEVDGEVEAGCKEGVEELEEFEDADNEGNGNQSVKARFDHEVNKLKESRLHQITG